MARTAQQNWLLPFASMARTAQQNWLLPFVFNGKDSKIVCFPLGIFLVFFFCFFSREELTVEIFRIFSIMYKINDLLGMVLGAKYIDVRGSSYTVLFVTRDWCLVCK